MELLLNFQRKLALGHLAWGLVGGTRITTQGLSRTAQVR